jgi:hypothetical protein
MSVYAVCPTATTKLQILAAVPNKVTFNMIPMAADAYCGINLTYSTTVRVFGYTYNTSLTPEVSVSLNSGVYTATKVNMTSMTFDTVTFQYLDS